MQKFRLPNIIEHLTHGPDPDLAPKNATLEILIPLWSGRRCGSSGATPIPCTGYLKITPLKSLTSSLFWWKTFMAQGGKFKLSGFLFLFWYLYLVVYKCKYIQAKSLIITICNKFAKKLEPENLWFTVII